MQKERGSRIETQGTLIFRDGVKEEVTQKQLQ